MGGVMLFFLHMVLAFILMLQNIENHELYKL